MIKVSQTYCEVTAESAEMGDFSETGFVFEEQEMSLKDLLREIRDQGAEEILVSSRDITIYGSFYTADYREGIERQEALHISASPRVIKRLNKILTKKH